MNSLKLDLSLETSLGTHSKQYGVPYDMFDVFEEHPVVWWKGS